MAFPHHGSSPAIVLLTSVQCLSVAVTRQASFTSNSEPGPRAWGYLNLNTLRCKHIKTEFGSTTWQPLLDFVVVTCDYSTTLPHAEFFWVQWSRPKVFYSGWGLMIHPSEGLGTCYFPSLFLLLFVLLRSLSVLAVWLRPVWNSSYRSNL